MNTDELQDRVNLLNQFLSPDNISLSKVGDNWQVKVENKLGVHIHSFQDNSLLAYLSGMEEIISMLNEDF